MSKPAFMKIRFALFFATLALATMASDAAPSALTQLPADAAALYRRAVLIPAGTWRTGSREEGCYPPETLTLAAFYLWPVETPVRWWQAFRPGSFPDARPDEPVTGITHAEAEAFCTWLSARYGVTARLPDRTEWEAAARAGSNGVTYPWGWALPPGLAIFRDATLRRTAAAPVGTMSPNPWGLYDMAGNVAEWCRPDHDPAGIPVMGGSWAERDPRFLRISHHLRLPATYADRDVGFRIVIEAP